MTTSKIAMRDLRRSTVAAASSEQMMRVLALSLDVRFTPMSRHRELDRLRPKSGALAKQPGFWVARFESLAEDRHLAVDKALHDELASTGEAAIRKNDADALRNLTFRLADNQVQTATPAGRDALSGFTRD